jgi:DNA-binding ferritin-like protein (Dps family)
MVKVLGAIAYGELKAYEGALAQAADAEDEAERRQYRTIAAEELRHHKGFVRRIEAMGGDAERAMRPYRTALDSYHGDRVGEDEVVEAVRGYLGEGIADDLLTWLRRVVDPETAEFVDSVIADEVGHEALATDRLRTLIDTTPGGLRRAGAGARRMLLGMAGAGRAGGLPLVAFLQVGRGPELVAAIGRGYERRLRAIGLGPAGVPLPSALVPDLVRSVRRARTS